MRSREEIESDSLSILDEYSKSDDLGEAILRQNQLLLETILDFREMFIEGNCQCDDSSILPMLNNYEQN